MQRRTFLRNLALGSAAAAMPISAIGAKGKKPNFLFLFADDQTYLSIHALTNPDVITPNLDKLVKRGVTFTHSFNQGSWSGAVCVCSRAMLNSGLHLYNAQKKMDETPLWGETLRKAGYNTYMTGKWHNSDSMAFKSFAVGEAMGQGMYGSSANAYNRPVEGKKDWLAWDKNLGGHWSPKVWDIDPNAKDPKKCRTNTRTVKMHTSDLYSMNAVNYLKGRKGKTDDPFFMYVAFNAPHDPRQSPKEYVDMYPLDKIKLPPNFKPEHPFDQGERYTLRDEKLAPFPRTEYAVKANIREYYAIITHADAAIGRVLDALEASGEADNTYVIFSADHGLAVGRHGLMGKQNQYDHSVRMPLIIGGPGLEAGRKIDDLVYLPCIYPTTCDLAGVPVPEEVEFKSLAPRLRGGKEKPYDAIFGSYKSFQRMVRTERYKLIIYPKVQQVQLFDLKNDPNELKNLAADPKMAGIRKRLEKRLRELQKDVGDTFDLDAPQPAPKQKKA